MKTFLQQLSRRIQWPIERLVEGTEQKLSLRRPLWKNRRENEGVQLVLLAIALQRVSERRLAPKAIQVRQNSTPADPIAVALKHLGIILEGVANAHLAPHRRIELAVKETREQRI